MTRKNPIVRSGTRLQRHGALWLEQTIRAGEAFLSDSRIATTTYARDMTKAGDKLASDWTRSTGTFRKALVREAMDWQKLVLKTRDAYIAAMKHKLQGLEQHAVTTRQALRPEAVEASVLESTRDLLQKAQTTVEGRMEKTGQPRRAPAKPRATKRKAAKPKTAKPKAATPSANQTQAPIRNYDQLSAKDVVNRVQRLSGPKATAVLDYERQRKKRATVIRAAEKRLSAAS